MGMGRRRSKKFKILKTSKKNRLPTIRHPVKEHKRRINGKTVTVKHHYRGEGERPPVYRRPRMIKKATITNRQFLYGDFDKDKTRNIDDLRPYDSKEKGSAEEILLSDEIQNLENYRESFEGTTEEMAKDFEKKGYMIKHRVKTPYSIMNKLRRKYLDSVQDIGGVLILVDTKDQAKKAAKYVESKYNIIDKDDYYKTPKQGYEAIHFNVIFKDNIHEIQIKTKDDFKKHLAWHLAYKKGEFTG